MSRDGLRQNGFYATSLALAAGLATLILLAAGCGDSNNSPVASLGATGTSSSAGGSSTGSTTASPLAFAACMRSHGLPSFPDPKPGGGFDFTGTGINRFSPQFDAANKACAALQPGGQKTPAEIRQHVKREMAEAACMRKHGVPYFPDPNSQGAIVVQQGSGWDPSSPKFRAAQKVCAHLNPGSG